MKKGKEQYRPRISKIELGLLNAYRDGNLTEFLSNIGEGIEDAELTDELIKLSKSKQRFQDLNRIERKTWRNIVRLENAITEYNSEILSNLDILAKSVKVVKSGKNPNSGKGKLLVQLTDTHFNELVDLPYNKYDFNIASERLKEYANHIKRLATAYNVNEIVVGITGDLINSDRRIDELMNMATSRAKATLIAVSLVKAFILDLAEVSPVKIVGVVGNESRFKDEIGFSQILATDNYDYTIYQILKLLFKNTDIKFIDTDPQEAVIDINGKNVLMLHGESRAMGNTQQGVQQVMGKYASEGIQVDYVLFGHIHFANVTDLYTRSGSLVGANGYSHKGIQLLTRASQVVHLFDGSNIHNFRIELQKPSGDKYDIKEDLEAYDARSLNKPKQGVTKITKI